jgi:threonine aldolase
MTWTAGVETVSLGGTKNGALGVEACVIFDPELAWEFELRRKRGGHLLSKHRYLSAQMQAYLTDGLWLDMAQAANARCAQLAEGLRGHNAVTMQFEPQANIIFFDMPRREHKRMLDGGAVYYVMSGDPELGDPEEELMGRLVCDWSMTESTVSQFLDLLRN